MTWYRNSNQIIVEPDGIATLENMISIRGGAAICLVDRDPRSEVLRVTVGICHVVLVRQENMREPAPLLHRRDDLLRPPWCIHHQVAPRALDQERVVAVGG